MLGAGVDVEHGIEQRADGEHHEQDGERQRDIPQHMAGGRVQLGHQVQPELDHQRRRHLRQTVKHFVVQKIVEPEQRRLTTERLHGGENDETHQTPKGECGDQQDQQTQGCAQHRLVFEQGPEFLGTQPE